MIGIITAATKSGNVLGYDLGDKTNKDQRIRILDFEGVFIDFRDIVRLNKNWTDAATKKAFKKLSRTVADDLSKQFDGQAQAALNERVYKKTGHIALSFSPLDREKLTDRLKVIVAREYMDRMGIEDTQWVLTEHFDTNAPHLHIAYNRVKFDGSTVNSKNERYRSMRISHEISKKYGLTPAGEVPRKRSSLHPDQQVYAQMREYALEALRHSLSFSEFEEELEERGVALQKSRHTNGEIYGLSYSVFDGAFVAKGSKLDRRKLSFKGVMAEIQNNINRFNQAYDSLPDSPVQANAQKQNAGPVLKSTVNSVQKLTALSVGHDQRANGPAINKSELIEKDKKGKGIKI